MLILGQAWLNKGYKCPVGLDPPTMARKRKTSK